ncbi:MAG: type I restriction endonuclease subunit R [Cytophagales bacterium]|nr:type I restriction endonuclease subunit R [Cytophagales bacterium]
METPSFKEDHISQILALQVLQTLGYTYLTPDEALAYRGNKTTNFILENSLRKQLKEINSIRVSSTETLVFSDNNLEAGIQALKNPPMQEGYITASESVYNLLTLGKSLEQSIVGEKKSFTLQYIDWQHPEQNVFHVCEEYSTMRSTTKNHYRPDIVLFINGIPVTIIECKRPDMKEPIKQAIYGAHA